MLRLLDATPGNFIIPSARNQAAEHKHNSYSEFKNRSKYGENQVGAEKALRAKSTIFRGVTFGVKNVAQNGQVITSQGGGCNAVSIFIMNIFFCKSARNALLRRLGLESFFVSNS